MYISNSIFNLKNVIHIFLFALFIWLAFNLNIHIKNTHGFILGDWLVNYNDGGFKRRGLSGSIFFALQDITTLKLKTLVYTCQMLLYLLFFFLIGKLLYKKTTSVLFFTLMLSPLTFMFFVNDPNIIGRKEILVYVIFAYYLNLKNEEKFKGYKVYLVCALLAIGTLLHEIFIFYIPYFIITSIVYDEKINIKENVLLFLSVFVPTVLIFSLGGLINEGESLNMLSERGVNFSTNKLNIFDFSNTLLSSLDRYRADPINYSLFVLSLILGIIHFSFYMKKEMASSDFKTVLKYFLLAIGYSLPLFILVCDWGRWLQIHFVMLFLLLLAKRPNMSTVKAKTEFLYTSKKNTIFFIVLISFLFTWRIYHFKWGFNLDGTLYFISKKIISLL